MNVSETFKVGGWVKSYSKGIHKIEKFVPVEYEEYHFFVDAIAKDKVGTLQEPLVIMKRMFNSKFKKQLGIDFCSVAFLKKLTISEQTTLNEQLKLNPNFITDLEKYEIPKFETRYGLHILLTEQTKSIISNLKLFVRENGKTFTEIFDWLELKGYKQLLCKNTSSKRDEAHYLQFINWTYDTKNKQLLFSDVLAFTPYTHEIIQT